MDVTFLGTGAAMPTGDRFQAGYVISEKDRAILLDCGAGTLQRLAQSAIGYEHIETILLSHHHLDHIADLLPLMKAKWLAGSATLEIVGPPGTEELVERLLAVHDYMADRLALTVRDIQPGQTTVGGFAIEAVETIHSVQCFAYRIEDELTFSGDTEPSDAVMKLATGSAVLIHECAFPDDVEVSNHTRPSELGDLLREADIGRVYLTHLYPHCQGKEAEMVEIIQSTWDGEVRIPDDLQTIRISAIDD